MKPATVAVVLGSDSDWEIMEACVTQLRDLGVEVDVQVLSAHRTPAALCDYVERAGEERTRVFIAAAGMSAALAGTIAAHTLRPVIGVPMDRGPLGGLDALLSTVQMPAGVPVATMALGAAGGRNAAILAAEILALQDTQLARRLESLRSAQAQKVRQRSDVLRQNIAGRAASGGSASPAGDAADG